MKTMEEIWKDIAGYEGHYKAGSLGNIMSLERQITNSRYGKGKIKQRLLKGQLKKSGYIEVQLRLDAVMEKFKAHRLIANAFISNPLNKPVVNHKNGIKSDNRVENLEWCTHSENGKHAFKIGLKKSPYGKVNKRSNKVVQMDLGGNFINIFDSYAIASQKTGVHVTNIYACVIGKYKKAGGFLWKKKY